MVFSRHGFWSELEQELQLQKYIEKLGVLISLWLPRGSDTKSACTAEDLGLIHGSGRSPREGNGNPPQYSCLGNPKDRGVWQTPVKGVTKESDTIQQLNKSLVLTSILDSFSSMQWLQSKVIVQKVGCKDTILDINVKQREKILSLEDREAHIFRRKNIFKLCLHRQHIRALI